MTWFPLAIPLVGCPQEPTPAESQAQGFTERRFDFEKAWAQADPELRDSLRAEILRYRNVGVPALQQVDSARLVRWTRLLQGQKIAPLPSELDRWIANLELRLLPGWASVEDLTKDPQIVVRVLAPSLPPKFPESATPTQLVLHWIDGEGQRTIARSSPVEQKDFKAQGFELYLQLPSKAEGLWRLEPGLVCEDSVLWGHAAPFLVCSPPRSAPEGSTPASAWARAAERWRMTGFRDLRWGDMPAEMGADPGSVDWETLESDGHGPALILRGSPAPGEAMRALVWVVVPGHRLLEAEFLGQRGLGWRSLASRGLSIVVSHAPLYASRTGAPPARDCLRTLVPELGENLATILVVRGNLGRGLEVAPASVLEGFDALVLLGARATGAAPRAPSGPNRTLFLLPSDTWSPPELPASQRAIVAMDPPLVMATDLPLHILENLDFLTSQDGEPGALKAEPR